MKNWTQVLVVSFLLLYGGVAGAQTVVTVPDDAKFVVQIDVKTFRHTKLGEKLVQLTEAKAKEELGGDTDDVLVKVEEALGFNPLEEIRTLTIVGSSFEDPEKDLRVMLQLGKTTGNIEGMMLALPEYDSEEYGDYTIHSARQDNQTAFAAIHTASDGNKRIVASTKRSNVIEMLDARGSNDREHGKKREISWSVPDGTFAQVQVLDFPRDIFDDGPQANIARLLENVSLTLGANGQDYVAKLALTTDSEKRAEQIQQMAQGLKAMVGLLEDAIGDDEDAQMAMAILKEVSVERQAKRVILEAVIPEDLIITFLREEADLPF